MEPSIEVLRKNYERLDDHELVRLATEKAAGLRPEAFQLLLQILKERGASPMALEQLNVQVYQEDGDEIDDYVEVIRRLPCPLCGSTGKKLNGSVVIEVVSFVKHTNYEKRLRIACPTCLDLQHKNAIITSALMGWWALPKGPCLTAWSFISNSEKRKALKEDLPTESLRRFIIQNQVSQTVNIWPT